MASQFFNYAKLNRRTAYVSFYKIMVKIEWLRFRMTADKGGSHNKAYARS